MDIDIDFGDLVKLRNGTIVGPIKERGNRLFCFKVDLDEFGELSWLATGRYVNASIQHTLDIVEVVN